MEFVQKTSNSLKTSWKYLITNDSSNNMKNYYCNSNSEGWQDLISLAAMNLHRSNMCFFIFRKIFYGSQWNQVSYLFFSITSLFYENNRKYTLIVHYWNRYAICYITSVYWTKHFLDFRILLLTSHLEWNI